MMIWAGPESTMTRRFRVCAFLPHHLLQCGSGSVRRGICATPSATLWQGCGGGWWKTLHTRMRTGCGLLRLCYTGVAGRACCTYATGVARGVAETGA